MTIEEHYLLSRRAAWRGWFGGTQGGVSFNSLTGHPVESAAPSRLDLVVAKSPIQQRFPGMLTSARGRVTDAARCPRQTRRYGRVLNACDVNQRLPLDHVRMAARFLE